ncbi:MAG: serine hydrolase [Lachnospiraceae bacterium]|nr:serine hydrolase [Lachnospiraceae bacterium]
MSQYNYLEDEIIKRKSLYNEKNRKNRRKMWYISLAVRVILPIMILIVSLIAGIGYLIKVNRNNEKVTPTPNISIEKTMIEDEPAEEVERAPVVYSASEGDYTTDVPGDVVSTYGILIDLEDDHILKSRNSRVRICPASMTKILTVLVAAENITEDQLDDTMTITLQFTDYSYGNDLSAVGFAENEVVTIRDLFYGTILPSGGDAAIALATYVAGSEEAFVELMNEKLKELHLSDSTHFTNVAGMYDEEHYSTVYDMAMILHAAIDNDFCRRVLNAHTYTTSQTEQHPEGITISNWFLRRIEDKDCGLTVQCAKTGFVVQSRNCAASFADDNSGHGYICVTADSSSGWRCIYDHVSIYSSLSGTASSLSLSDDALSDDDVMMD